MGFYHAIEYLFVRSPYKGVLQRAHIMRNRNHNIARMVANFNWVQTGLKASGVKVRKLWFFIAGLAI